MKSAICVTIMLYVSITWADVLFEKVVFQRYDNGYNTYRIPALYETQNGVLLAFAEGRVNGTSDTGNIDTVLRRSFDGGVTWQPMQVVWSDGTNTCGNPTVVQDGSNGRIWMFMTHNLGQDSQSEIADGTSDGVRTIWSCYSDNDGATWSAPVNRFSQVQPSTTRWDATGPGRGLQLAQGTKAGRLIIPAIGRNIQSDNNGTTWTQSASLPGGSSEAQVVEIQGGTLFRNDRAVSNKELNRRALCRSYNQGLSWTALDFNNSLTCPICQASTIALPDSSTIYGRMLVFANPSATTRINMSVQYSYNDGANWTVKKMIYPAGSAYCCLSPVGAGIGLLYENGDAASPATSLYKRITFAKFSRQWVKDKAVVTWDFEEYQPGQTITTAAGMVKDKRGYALNTTADISYSVVAGAMGSGSAVRFTGGGYGIRITDANARKIINFNNEDSFTARVVFRTTSHCSEGTAGSGSLVSKDVGANTKSWWLRVQDGKLRFLIDDSTVTASVWSTSTVCDGKWYEVIATRDASTQTLKMYVNGKLEGQSVDNTTQGFVNTNAVSVGCFNTTSSSFIGDIAKVQLYRSNADNIVSFFDGDLDADNTVDMQDLFIMSGNWLDNSSPSFDNGDINDDGSVDAYDFAIVAKNWLKTEF